MKVLLSDPDANAFVQTVKGAGKLPLNDIFKSLAEQWMDKNNTTSRVLAESLNISPQLCSAWKTGAGKRRPSWWAVLWLLHQLDQLLIVQSSGVIVRPREGHEELFVQIEE